MTEGQAHHVVVVYDNTDGARKASIYVDGVATTQDDPLAVQDDRGLPFQFGSYNGALLLDGIYDDIQIYTRAITAEEVGQLKDNPGSSLPVGDNAPIDSDGDGLVDTREAELGTDPLVTDTDGDTLSDFDEVEVHMTNPLVLDTDEDGFEDGVELAAGNDPTDPSDGDNDRDGLTNGQEAELGTDPLNRDTDGDRFSDSFEVANGFDPLDPNSPDNSQGGPIPTRVLTGKLAEDTLGDLVVTGSFTHAVNVAETEEDVQVGDILFLRDTPAPENIEIAAQNHIEDWNAPNDFGAGPVAEGLAKVASGIRWSGQPEGVVVTLKDVDRGAYRLQMIFGEKCCDRGFFVKVNGEDIVETFSPNAFQEGDHSGAAAAYLIYEFNQTEAGDLVIDLNGTDAGFADGNAILSGVSLQFVQSLDPGEIVPVHYENDFNAYANDETDLRDGSIITSNQGTAKIVDMALQLTEDGVGGESASFKLPVLPELAEGFVFEADLLLASDGQPADGFSFNYGEIDDNASAGEEGFQNGLAVEFDTWNNGGEGADTGIGIDVSLDGNDVEIMRLEAGEDVKDSRFFNFDGEFHPISITWEPGVGVTVVIDGETIYDKLTLEGFEATSEMRIAFGARTGGSTETVQFDNMKVSGLDSRSSTSTLAEGLVAYYPLDGSLDDTAGNSHGVGKTWQPGGKQDQPELLADHPEVALTFTEGAFGQGVDLVGSEAQYIETPLANEDIFDFGAPDNPTGFTVSAWFRVDSFTKGWQALVAKGEQNQWRIHRQGGDTDRVVGNGGDGDIAREGPDVNDGEIHHIVLISEPEVSHRIFLDGVLIEAGNAPNLEDNPMPMMIGQNPDTDDRTWDGLIDDVAFWNRALTDDEVDTLANSGASLQQILTLRKGPNLPDGYVAGGPDLAGAEGLSGYYWNLGIKEIPTSGEPMHREGDGPEGADTSNSGWADNNVFNSRAITGSFDAKTFQYEGNDLTPIGEWLGDDAASYDGSDGNLDDGLFRMVGYVYAAEAGEKTITFDNGSDDGLVVYIADEAVVENDNGHGEGDPVSGTYNFPAEGYYPIDIRYFNGDWTNDAGDHGGANLRNNNLAEDLTLVQGVAGVDPFYTPMMPAGTGYANDFTYDDGTTDLGDGSIIASNDGTNSVQGGALQMTLAGTNSTASSFILPPMDLSAGWTATFDFVIEHTGENTPADGFSFNYGAIPEGENFGDPAEEGYGAATPHVSYQVDTWLWNDAAGQDAGVGIEVTGTEIALTKATDDNANFQPNERVEASATMSWHPENGASFHTTGLRTNADFTNIPTGDFAAEAGYGFSFLARTGGHNETLLIDNLVVTPGVVTPVSRDGAVAISSGPITESTVVDFGDLTGDATYEFSFKAMKGGASTAIAGNDAWGLKLDQWNEQGVFGTTEFGVADNIFDGVASIFDEDVHVAFVSDTTAGETRLYIDSMMEKAIFPEVNHLCPNFYLRGLV
ncbi:MAG: LamG-like jellyroll fold domain-containing protein [Verrucomicrobiota bacterium]